MGLRKKKKKDSEVDFRSLGVVLVVLGWLLGCIFSVLGCRWSSWDGILGSFWGSWGAAGVHFVGLGLPLGTFGAQSSRKTAPLFRRRSLFDDFGAQRVPKKASKMEQKSVKNGFKNPSIFLIDFSSVSEAFFLTFGRILGPWTFKNELLV